MHSHEVIIVGAGLAGLTARSSSRRGLEVAVLEASDASAAEFGPTASTECSSTAGSSCSTPPTRRSRVWST